LTIWSLIFSGPLVRAKIEVSSHRKRSKRSNLFFFLVQVSSFFTYDAIKGLLIIIHIFSISVRFEKYATLIPVSFLSRVPKED
jgi:hypothetical protein